MLTEQIYIFEQCDIGIVLPVLGELPFFRASDVTTALGYVNGSQAIRTHVDSQYVRTQTDLEGLPNYSGPKKPLYVSFPGVMMLLNRCSSPKADLFRTWLSAVFFPELDKHNYETSTPPDDEPTEGDALYVMSNPLLPHMVKIGRSIHPEARAKELSKSQPFHITACHQYEFYGFLEKIIHRKLSKLCILGGRGREWFKIEPHQADLLIRAAILEHHILS